MSLGFRLLMLAGLLASTLRLEPSAQTEFTNNFKFNTGQSVQPVFEGWSWAADGSVNMHFGYLNRNYVQEPHIPVGANNSIQPGGPDRGQPTYFYSRTQRNLFTVNVPKDWGRTREIVWTITVNGKTEKALGWLQLEWEIDPVGGANTGGRTDPEYVKNKPPSLSIDAVAPVTLPATLSLTGTVTDDGLPKPRGRGKPAVGQETPPTLQGGTDAPVNVPQVVSRETPPGATAGGGGGGGAASRPQGPSVTWIVWRGPAGATFSPRTAPPKDGKASTTVTFGKPGEYVLRGIVTDSLATGRADVKVVVQ